MSSTLSVEATPAKIADAISEIRRRGRELDRAEEREQVDAISSKVAGLVDVVSKRERVLVSIDVHSDPGGEGFNARRVGVTISRIDPESIRQREEDERLAAEQQAERERLEAERPDVAVAVDESPAG